MNGYQKKATLRSSMLTLGCAPDAAASWKDV